MARMVNCIKLGREAEALDFPPYPGELGKRDFESVSKEAWQQWIRMQTMIINENLFESCALAWASQVSGRADRKAFFWQWC